MQTTNINRTPRFRPGLGQRGWFVRVAGLLVFVGSTVVGCSNPRTAFSIVDYREGEAPQHYGETFDEVYYGFDDAGNLDVVARRALPASDDPTQDIVQIVHMHGVWRSIPGTTVANDTQINATVGYIIMSGGMGATFEGAGSLFVTIDSRRETARGTLGHATLKPLRQVAGGARIFTSAEVRGQFQAVQNRARTVAILNEVNRFFGPLPRYQPAR